MRKTFEHLRTRFAQELRCPEVDAIDAQMQEIEEKKKELDRQLEALERSKRPYETDQKCENDRNMQKLAHTLYLLDCLIGDSTGRMVVVVSDVSMHHNELFFKTLGLFDEDFDPITDFERSFIDAVDSETKAGLKEIAATATRCVLKVRYDSELYCLGDKKEPREYEYFEHDLFIRNKRIDDDAYEVVEFDCEEFQERVEDFYALDDKCVYTEGDKEGLRNRLTVRLKAWAFVKKEEKD